MAAAAVEMAVAVTSTSTVAMATTSTAAPATVVDKYNNQLIVAAEEMAEAATAMAMATERTIN